MRQSARYKLSGQSRSEGSDDTAIAALACLECDDFSTCLPTSAITQLLSFSDATNLGIAALGHCEEKVVVYGQAQVWKTRPTALLLKHPLTFRVTIYSD